MPALRVRDHAPTVRLLALCPALALVSAACADDPIEPLPDTGVVPPDTGNYVPPDAGHQTLDASAEDLGPLDAGFRDPDIWLDDHSEVHGLRTHIKIVGATTSTMPPAIFAADGPGLSHEYLLPHLKALMPGRILVFYDMRGTGTTSYGDLTGTSTLTARRHADDLAELIDFLADRIDTTKVDLVGHGYGAGIAALYAGAHPERVSRLVLITPYPAHIDELVDSQGEFNRRMTSPQRERFMALLNQHECFQNDSRCYLQVFDTIGANAMCPQNRNLWSELHFEFGSFRTLWFVETQLKDSRFDWRPSLRNITASTTVIGGACDSHPAAVAATYATEIAGARLITMDDSGRYPFVESPVTFFGHLGRALMR
ncbi:MAG: alpha/beta fold hydrolase [Deltaproteobacteria bacterium]|nr:alpha/beta fold hydrolase [Deltaproteobacteria bacterium]